MHVLSTQDKVTNTHSEYVIVIAFPQQELGERASMLRL